MAVLGFRTSPIDETPRKRVQSHTGGKVGGSRDVVQAPATANERSPKLVRVLEILHRSTATLADRRRVGGP